MALSTTMYRTESYFHEDRSIDQPILPHSNQFNYSIHNCSCNRLKAGLILYPKDNQMKNVILLVCNQCYNYELEDGSSHIQLEKWYFNIYKDSKSFHFKSRFIQNEDKTFYFYEALKNSDELFHIKERDLDHSEKEAIEKIIIRKQR
jgi:hypothetical protein